MSANDKQVGGNHYKTKYEHWDLVVNTRMGYLEGTSTKYISRWHKKDGIKDLQKAKHYLEKLIEVYPDPYIPQRILKPKYILPEIDRYAEINGLSSLEKEYFVILAWFEDKKYLRRAETILEEIIKGAAENTPGTPADGGHHA